MRDAEKTKEQLLTEVVELRRRVVHLESAQADLLKAEERLSKVYRTLRALSSCNEVLVHSTEEPDLLMHICRIILEVGGYRLCWVGYREDDAGKTVRPAAQAGYEEGYFGNVNISWADNERGRGPTGTAVRTGQVSRCTSLLTDPSFSPWRDDALKRGYASVVGLPLLSSGHTMGAITIYASEVDAFDAEELKLLAELADNLAYGIVALRVRDDRLKAEERLRASEEKYRSLVQSTGDPIYLVDREYRYVFINKVHLSRLGTSLESFQGKLYSEVHSPEETAEFVEKVDKVFATGESVQHEHLSRRDKRYFLRTLSPVKDAGGATTAVTVVSKDITRFKQMEEKLRALSLTDELTGLYNRRGFFTLVDQLLKLAKRQQQGVYMLYGDLDNLKGINDTLGHQQGDQALRDTANLFRATYRESDIIARIGGDEFVVIPVGIGGDNIEGIRSRLLKKVEHHNEKANRRYKLSVSFGLVYYDPEDPCSIDELLLRADRLMYEQKKNKRKV
jgi:diguanylate cyclase (GGDEF)-like protein/PAS domain S-box-containing protein